MESLGRQIGTGIGSPIMVGILDKKMKAKIKPIHIFFVMTAQSFGFDFATEAGLLKIQSDTFILKRDTVVHSEGDDVVVAEVKNNDFYLCSGKETTETIVSSAQIIRNGKATEVQVGRLYNIDSAHKNISYLKYRKIGNREFLFSKLGPPPCQYYVVWEKQKNQYKQVEMFEATIDHDVYSDENILKAKLNGVR